VVVGAVVGLADGGHLVGARGPGRPCPNCEQRVILILLPRVQLAVPTAICRTTSEPSSVFLVQSSREWNISLIFGMRRTRPDSDYAGGPSIRPAALGSCHEPLFG
jgi:hypothetical protein